MRRKITFFESIFLCSKNVIFRFIKIFEKFQNWRNSLTLVSCNLLPQRFLKTKKFGFPDQFENSRKILWGEKSRFFGQFFYERIFEFFHPFGKLANLATLFGLWAFQFLIEIYKRLFEFFHQFGKLANLQTLWGLWTQ